MIAMDRAPFRYAVVTAGLLLIAQLGSAQNTDPIVADVVPTGNRLIPSDQITGQMKTKRGSRLSQTALEQDQFELKKSGAFSDVRIRTLQNPDGRITVFADVVEYPSLVQDVRYEGAKHLKVEELDQLSGIRRGTPLNPTANQKACYNILEKLHDQGRRFASVVLEKGWQIGDTSVVFRITEGPISKIAKIDIIGHTDWVSTPRLKTQINSSRSILTIGGDYEPKKVEADVMALVEYYKNLGYLDVRVYTEFIPQPDESHLKLIFHIFEGVRYRIGKIQLNGNKVYTEDQLMKLTKLREGEFYEKKVIQADLKLIEAKYGYEGRKVPVEHQYFVSGEGEVTVQYEVREMPPVHVGNIEPVGNTRTRTSVILKQIGLYPGQILTFPDLQVAEERLRNSGLFEVDQQSGVGPRIEVRDLDTPGDYKDIFVHVQETSTGTFMLGLGINSDAGLTGNIVINERNFDILNIPRNLDELLSGSAFRGAGQEFRVELTPGTTLQRYSVSWRDPSIADSKFSLAISLYYYERAYNEYGEDRTGMRVAVGRQLNRYWNASETVRVEGVDIYGIAPGATPAISDFAGHHFQVGFRSALTRDTRDSYLRPTTGSVLDFAFEEVLGDYDFPLATAEFKKFWTTYQRRDGSGKQVLSMRSQIAFAGDNTPVYERFYAGGFSSMRGFEFRGVGPFENGLNVGGRFSFLNTIEYQIPVLANDKFFLVGFVDHGTVESKVDLNNYRITAGLGFRVVTPLTGPVPIAFDFGVPIRQGPNDIKQLVSFYVGFSS
jgi:outer membrane protein insertion porin family